MKTERTFDTEMIWRFMTRPDMWSTVAEDGQVSSEFKPDVSGECWLSMTVDNEVIALFQIQQRNGVTVEIHAQVLPEHRKLHSGECGKEALKWIMNNDSECQKVIAWIPELYPNVRDFAVSYGFKLEGCNRDSYMKNGKLQDQWLMGITRNETGVMS